MAGKFQPTAVSQVIALAHEGEETSSNFAPYKQMKFTLTDGRVWYASLAAAKKLQNLNVAVGNPFRVCLREYAPGKNVLDILPAPAPVSKLEGQLRASLDAINYDGPEPDGDIPAYPWEPAARNGNGHATPNGNGHTAAASLMTGQSQGMLDQFIAVYEVLVAVETYSALKGRAVQFTSEDFRSTAISCYIQKSREGGR